MAYVKALVNVTDSRTNFDTPGVMGFTTADLAIVLEVAAKYDPMDPKCAS